MLKPSQLPPTRTELLGHHGRDVDAASLEYQGYKNLISIHVPVFHS